MANITASNIKQKHKFKKKNIKLWNHKVNKVYLINKIL